MREFSRHGENSPQLARLEVPAREGRETERTLHDGGFESSSLRERT